jgi:hypothetical protein
MVSLQAFADFDPFTKVQVDGLYYNIDNDSLQAQVTSMYEGEYTGDVVIPVEFTLEGKVYSVTSIGDWAFSSCTSLASITIPASVTTIGGYAFEWCSNLTSLTVLNPTPVPIYADIITKRMNTTLYVPIGSKSAYQAANYWKNFKEIVEIDVTGIKNGQCSMFNGQSSYFTLDGKRIHKSRRGINIIGGKKIVIK